ncbi:TPA: hypothetical protein I8034_002397 [Legionella pneumophila]|nr:hypothetical protein [Legionella pneumophila subsp. fraseri]HAT1773018.1 hypothetical protein [Legionella pneumophila]MDX1847181.1 hypothetical protein [Legionella pneumophila subsp. fraseri]HAT2128406.1 hypothetical protein [Legionella pneumophila]HAT2136921.1 hypothetical protein [Legionella pneumophila]
MSAQENLDQIKKLLMMIKNNGGHLSQYDSKLYELFIDSYKNNYMDFNSNPRLTADAISSYLSEDEEYQGCPNKTSYDLDVFFHDKWQYWTEAIQKGLFGGYIKMISDNEFDEFEYENLPIEMDMLLVGDKYLDDYYGEWEKFFKDKKHNPYIGYFGFPIQVISVKPNTLEIRLFIFSKDRYHETIFELPKNDFIRCVSVRRYDNKPCIFVKNDWLKKFSENQFSCYGLIDESNYRDKHQISTEHKYFLINKQKALKKIASKYPNILFILYSDSILLKFSWFINEYNLYTPEQLIKVFKEIELFFNKNDSECYGIFTQGINFGSSNELFTSKNNLVDLNVNGSAFADLFCIDKAVRTNIKKQLHSKEKMYFDENLFYSLNISQEIKENLRKELYEYTGSFNKNMQHYVIDHNSSIYNLFEINTQCLENPKISFLKKIFHYFIRR